MPGVFVDDELLRERLKEAKGIGTPATREKRGNGNANLSIGRRHQALRRGDVRPALQKRRRHFWRYHRHRDLRFRWGNREFGGRLADQNRDGVLELSARHADRDRLRLR